MLLFVLCWWYIVGASDLHIFTLKMLYRFVAYIIWCIRNAIFQPDKQKKNRQNNYNNTAFIYTYHRWKSSAVLQICLCLRKLVPFHTQEDRLHETSTSWKSVKNWSSERIGGLPTVHSNTNCAKGREKSFGIYTSKEKPVDVDAKKQKAGYTRYVHSSKVRR